MRTPPDFHPLSFVFTITSDGRYLHGVHQRASVRRRAPFTVRVVLFAICALLFTGCASWFQERVDKQDQRIEVLEQRRDEAATPEEQKRIDEALEDERESRDRALEGALEEQKNKQALLMALISLGVGGLKLAGATAAKGAL